MHFFSRRLTKRILSIVMLLVMITSTLHSTVSYALTTGPHQPEYISYEAPGASDMVNLNTGDFTFSLPLLEVPGPEGSFSLPLTYNAGIGVDQEASWVGLGWTMNAGAITRTINAFPDDAQGESQSVTVQDLDGIRGWDANTVLFGKFGWNNQVGHYGNLGLMGLVNASWTENFTSVGVAGVNVTSNGVKVDPIQTGMALFTVATMGLEGAVAETVNAVSLGITAVQTAQDFMSSPVRNPSTGGYWDYQRRQLNLGVFKKYRVWLDKTRVENMYGNLYLGNAPTDPYSNDLNAGLALKNGGTTMPLYKYQRSTATSNQGAASDINYEPDPTESYKQFYEINNPVMLAPDNFSVKASGISGSIAPYRLEVASVSMPREMTANHDRLAPVKYSVYKVPFKYNGQLSNSYFQHVGATSSPIASPNSVNFGITPTVTTRSGQSNLLTYELNDIVFGSEPIKPGIPSSKKIAAANDVEWLSNDEIRNGITYPSKFMDFLSGGAAVSGGTDRYLFRSGSPVQRQSLYTSTTSLSHTIQIQSQDVNKIGNGSTVDLYLSMYTDAAGSQSGTTSDYQSILGVVVNSASGTSIVINDTRLNAYLGKYADIEISIAAAAPQSLNSIGGFCVTGADGVTYHFALPVYDYDQQTEVRNVNNPTTKRSVIKRAAAFANTWLLTGITGPDFIDRNQNGMIDETDWGYWVKFNYARHSNDYQWRLPYSGFKQLPNGDPNGATQETFTGGKKQLYYLNSVETRSHVALFLKSDRSDGNSVSLQKQLRLDEIVLIGREAYKKLTTPTAQGGLGLPDYSANVTSVLRSGSANLSTAILDFLKFNCLKRIGFDCTYSLGQSIPTYSTSGKLTLNKVWIKGRNDSKIIPDYKFTYGNNLAYNATKWDGWGMYNPSGTAASPTHDASNTDSDAAAWSLTKITTPLGSEITVNYERDVYTNVSGSKLMGTNENISNNSGVRKYNPSGGPITRLYVDNNSNYSVGQNIVIIGGQVNYSCNQMSPIQTTNNYSKSFGGEFTIASKGSESVSVSGTNVTKQYIDLGADYMSIGSCGLPNSIDYIELTSQIGGIFKILPSAKGGNLRVGSIVMTDQYGVDNKMRYLYSGGTISLVPPYINISPFTTQNSLGYPETPVMYAQVSVLTGKLDTDANYHSRIDYNFETPNYSQYTLTKTAIQPPNTLFSQFAGVGGFTYKDYISIYENKYDDRTSVIGRLNSMSTSGSDGSSSSSILTYAAQNEILNDNVNNYQGVYTNGAIMFDRVSGASFLDKYHKINRTTSLQYPNTLKKVVNTKNGFVSESTNLSWDLISGTVNQKLDKTSTGLYVKTVVKPAYKETPYGEMGSKADNPSNKNMLSQVAAVYTYKSDATGANLSLLSSQITTWKKGWDKYRDYNSSTQTYSDSPPNGETVWRKSENYAYKGPYSARQTDGTLTFGTGNEFNFSSSSNTGWMSLGGIDRYDHFSMPLVSKDINGLYSTTKMGYDNRLPLATASNANYEEIAFSSAEDLIPGTTYFGSEVALGSGTVLYKSLGQTAETHTGDAVVSLSANNSSFKYVPNVSKISTNRTYRVSAWTNSVDGRLYYNLNGTLVLSDPPTIQKKIGNWYQLNLEIPIQNTLSGLEVGVKVVSGGANSLFDDFRFQPVTSGMTANVVNPLTYLFTSGGSEFRYVLDNDNLFTKYEYNGQGLLVKTYRETFKYGIVLVSENKQHYRRFTTNQ